MRASPGLLCARPGQYAMGICWTRCCSLFRRESHRIQRSGGGSKYFKTSRGEHFTIEFENLVESDELAIPDLKAAFLKKSAVISSYDHQMSAEDMHRPNPRPQLLKLPARIGCESDQQQRPLSEEEISDLKERHYNSITERQSADDVRLQNELALQEENLKLEEEALYAAQREAARAAKQKKILEQHRLQWIRQRAQAAKNGESSVAEDFESYLRGVKSQYETFRNSRLSSEANLLTPNTESSCDLTTRTKSSGNDDNTSLDLEWEDEEGMNRMVPLRERSKTEEDILRAALKYSDKKPGSHTASASDDSNGLEWENDFVSAEMDDNGNSEYAGFVNPVTELSTEQQDSSVAEDFESYLRGVKSQYETFRNSRLSSEANLLTPNTESSCDLTTRTKSSGNDDNTSLDLEWEDEEGMNRMVPLRERSKTEEDILRAALKYSDKKPGSHTASASDDSNGLEWENDFVSAEMDDNGNSEYAGFVNPVTELSTEQQDR